MSEIIYVIALSLGSIIALFLLTKLMGYRQMSQMSMFDYVNGITIGSIAAEMSTSLDENFMQPLVAMIVYSLAAVFLSRMSSRFIRVRRIVEGKPLVLMDHGELYRENLKKAKIDVSEFLVQCRVNGYFDVSDLECAVLEGNGKISFLPKADARPLTPEDLELAPEQDYLVANVILDGNLMEENLHHTGRDKKWLEKEIRGQGVRKIEDVLLATCDQNGTVTVFPKNSRKNTSDILM
jgi:uncharacterized membrane protein YcaP (DUF421 family)